MDERHFPCDACGLCCRNIGDLSGFETLDRGDGVCIHLTEMNRCGIYETRPLHCRVEEGYEHFFASMMSWDVYVSENQSVCKRLKQEAYDGA